MVGHVTPYKIKKKCYFGGSCIVGAMTMLLFMVEQIFLLWGRFGQCIMQYTMHSVGKEEAKEQRRFFVFKFSLIGHTL